MDEKKLVDPRIKVPGLRLKRSQILTARDLAQKHEVSYTCVYAYLFEYGLSSIEDKNDGEVLEILVDFERDNNIRTRTY